VRRFALGVAALLALAGCAATPAEPHPGGGDAAARPTTVTVFAAASLSGVFTTLGDEFEAQHPGVTVDFNFGGSSGLAAQIGQAAPADVFAAASPETMRTVVDAGLASHPSVFATNTLQIAVPAGNPGEVGGLAAFADESLVVALCAPEVPCGAAAAKVLAAAGVTASADTLEEDVKAVLTKVELGEADAGLVYRTDVLAAGAKVEGVDIPGAENAANEYPIVALDNASPAAAEFVAYVLSAEARSTLEAAGFGAP
jgi:molybdate transport system substrate-binding protein